MILLDTVALIRFVLQIPTAEEARQRVWDAQVRNELFLSAASVWELCLLERRPRTGPMFGGDGAAFLARAQQNTRLRVVPIDATIAIESRRLPGDFHQDPSDRFVVATARGLNACVITSDEPILDYAKLGHVKALAC